MKSDHYATLGLTPDASDQDIRAAYRMLAKSHHPDVNPAAAAAPALIQAINEAYAVLSDPELRQEYDSRAAVSSPHDRSIKRQPPLTKEVQLPLQDFLRGVDLDVQIDDPANPDGPESYHVNVPPETAPGARLRVPREGRFSGSQLVVHLKARPDSRFKARGVDLRCDLRITPERAAAGGAEMVRGLMGNSLRIQIPKNCAAGSTVKIADEGLPRSRGGRGDLVVRLLYKPRIRVTRAPRR